MCGFAGYKTALTASNDQEILKTISEAIAHRGPDDAGVWQTSDKKFSLISRRLSILDLSVAGAQPMHDAQQSLVLVFNGEIYNAEQLKQELIQKGHTFNSHCDTQVVLNAYKEWGADCLQRFDGMFAGAIYNRHTDALFLFRDRMGIKPLYFSMQGGSLSFASEIKALWCMPWNAKRVSSRAVSHYLTYLASPAPMTLYEGVYKLPAGFCATYEKNDISFTQWYDPLSF